MLLGNLNLIKNSGDLREWVMPVDEVHRFASDPKRRTLLIEARKWVGKMLRVTTHWRVYEGIANVFNPLPRPPEV
jgi:hypothetical protein